MITTLGDMICQARTLLDDLPETSGFTDTNLALLQEAAEGQDESNLLWTTAELKQYANEAIDEVALRTGGVRDSSAIEGLTAFTIGPDDDPWQPMDSRILRIVRVTWNGRRLWPTSQTEQDRQSDDWPQERGDPRRFALDQGMRRIRPVPAPASEGVLQLSVVRLPVTTMVNLTDEPETPVHQRANAVHWMLHRAYLKNDADAKDDNQAAKYLTLFERVFGPRPTERQLEFSARALGVTRRPTLHWF